MSLLPAGRLQLKCLFSSWRAFYHPLVFVLQATVKSITRYIWNWRHATLEGRHVIFSEIARLLVSARVSLLAEFLT